jgi:hypothetical protein
METRSLLSIFTPIPLGSEADLNAQTFAATYPTGDVTFAGVPFSIPTSGNNIVWNNNGPHNGTIVKDFPVGVSGVTQVQTLINTTFGQPGPNSYLQLEFFGSAGADYTVGLIVEVDMRDYVKGAWTNTINGTSTINVFTTSDNQHYRIDKQTINLPSEFASQTLTSIRMVDTGAFNFQRGVLYGITVSSGSPDLAATSLTWDTAQGGVDFGYQVNGAALPQDTTAALYWASGTTEDTILEPAATPIPIPKTTPVGQAQTGHVAQRDIQPPPSDAKELLLVVNPSGPNHVQESDETNDQNDVAPLRVHSASEILDGAVVPEVVYNGVGM